MACVPAHAERLASREVVELSITYASYARVPPGVKNSATLQKEVREVYVRTKKKTFDKSPNRQTERKNIERPKGRNLAYPTYSPCDIHVTSVAICQSLCILDVDLTAMPDHFQISCHIMVLKTRQKRKNVSTIIVLLKNASTS